MPRMATEERFFRNPMVPYKEYKRIKYEPGRVTRIKLNRPRYLNAQSHAMFGELEDAYDRACENTECHVIVVSGEGRCFSCGDDANGLTPESAPCLVTDETAQQLIERFGSERALWHQYNIEHDYYISWWLHQKLPRTPKPTIAMVHSYCIYGAFAHATGLDIIFASEDALFLGGLGKATWDLGSRKALELAYENRFMTAREALENGSINRVFPDHETLERETLAFAERLASEVPTHLQRIKQAYLQTLDCQGYTAAYEANRTPSAQIWRNLAADGNAMRYEGKGMARTPAALFALATKLESEGAEVPTNVIEALARAAARDDKAAWQKALHQEWRAPERLARADADAKAWGEKKARAGGKDTKEMIEELLEKLRK
ncbi:MAG: enoyl-CoA hydratase-related protein [Dehalococcoidia bacterium]|nr:enoyl-CoA hydratase-related protein [Dehalococcoidia bacterium]